MTHYRITHEGGWDPETAHRCQHYDCKCWRAAELAAQGRTREAVGIHDDDVTVLCVRAPKEKTR